MCVCVCVCLCGGGCGCGAAIDTVEKSFAFKARGTGIAPRFPWSNSTVHCVSDSKTSALAGTLVPGLRGSVLRLVGPV